MVFDIAYRMAVLNPDLLENVVEMTPGIVLIDEIDLHLHPRWQWKIIDALKNTFPRVQFIVTTHSPVIIAAIGGYFFRQTVGDHAWKNRKGLDGGPGFDRAYAHRKPRPGNY